MKRIFILTSTLLLTASLFGTAPSGRTNGTVSIVPTAECAPNDVSCNQCADDMLISQRAAEEGGGWCAGQAVGLVYCQTYCPNCTFCRLKAANYSVDCMGEK